ncbi:MAG TPA: trehalose-6-phosphate synthase, partial [Candidatus Limnocylindrales bacterium]
MQTGHHPARIGEELLGGSRLFVVSNRGPLSIVPDEESPDRLSARRGSGGLVTALGGIAAHLPVTWVAAALDDGDRVAARSRGSLERIVRAALPGHDLRLVLVALPEEVHRAYYGVVANPFLWFLQHGLELGQEVAADDGSLLDAWRTGYVAANERMAAATLRAIARVERPVVWVHDYQLYLVPELIRRARPDATIAHFTHIPWPAHSAWEMAPDP